MDIVERLRSAAITTSGRMSANHRLVVSEALIDAATEIARLREDAERISWLAANMRRVYGRRDVGGYELPDIATVESCREFCDPQHLREAIDAARDGAND